MVSGKQGVELQNLDFDGQNLPVRDNEESAYEEILFRSLSGCFDVSEWVLDVLCYVKFVLRLFDDLDALFV